MTEKQGNSLIYINHDIRNYIGAAISHTQLLSMQYPNLEGNPFTKAIVQSLNEATELSERVSTLAQACEDETYDDSDSKLTDYELNEEYFKSVDRSYDEFRTAYNIEINVSYELREGDYAIRLNLEELKALRHNLISNAHEAGASVINATYEMKEYCLVVTLRDNGRGMDQESLDKIILAQHGDGVVHGVGTKSILKTAKENGFFVSFSSEEGEGTCYRALCPYAKV